MKKVEVTTTIRAHPAAVIAAFTDTEMLRDWWNVECTLIEKKPGGLYTLAWDISEKALGFISTGIIREYQSHGLLIIDNFVYINPAKSFLGPMTLTINAKENGDTTDFYLYQDGYQTGADWDWYYDAVTQPWPTVVQTLKAYLEGKSV